MAPDAQSASLCSLDIFERFVPEGRLNAAPEIGTPHFDGRVLRKARISAPISAACVSSAKCPVS